MTEPDYCTDLVMKRLAAIEARIAAGEPSGPPAPVYVAWAPGRAILVFETAEDDPDLVGHVARLHTWLAQSAFPVELRARWMSKTPEETAE